jgi:hypothetical protein
MVFFVFIAAILLELLGTYVSVVGISKTFAGDPVILTLAVVWDFAKIVTVSLLYSYWDRLNKFLKYYLAIGAIVLMTITSYGAAGYLSDSFQKATLSSNTSSMQLAEIEKEKVKLETRKLEIDKQIAQIPPDMIKARIRLTNNFKTEIERINNRTVELDTLVPELKTKQLEVEAHIGPISYISKLFGVSLEKAVSIIIGLIIFVFEPLAIALILAGNFLLADRKKNIVVKPAEEVLLQLDPIDELEKLVAEELAIEFNEELKDAVEKEEIVVKEVYDDFGFEKNEKEKQKILVDHLKNVTPKEKLTMTGTTTPASDYYK